MQVTTRGFRKWLTRPMSSRQRGDMKVLAHIREQYGLSFGSYGRPRTTMELKEAGLDVGERRVGRLMKINGIKPVRTRKHKITTNSSHSPGIVANVLDGDFTADAPNRKWAKQAKVPAMRSIGGKRSGGGGSAISGPPKVGSTLQ